MLLGAFIMFGCHNSRENSLSDAKIQEVFVDIDKAQNIKLSDIIDKHQYVRLQTEKESIIGKIDKIIIADEKIVVIDKSITQSVFFFNLEGAFLGKIKKIGRGPGEYQVIKDVVYDAENNQLNLYDSKTTNMLKYDMNGRFISQTMLHFMFSAFQPYHQTYIVSTNKMINKNSKGNEINYKFMAIDTAGGKIINTFHPYDTSKKVNNRSLELLYPIARFKDDLFIAKLFSDTVFCYVNDRLTPLLKIDYGKYTLPANVAEMASDEQAKYMYSKTNYALGHTINGITENFFSFTYGFKDYMSKQNWFLLSRATGKTYCFGEVSNDMNAFSFNYPLTANGDEFVSVIEYKEPTSAVSIDDNAVFKDFDSMQNPILMFYTLKLAI